MTKRGQYCTALCQAIFGVTLLATPAGCPLHAWVPLPPTARMRVYMVDKYHPLAAAVYDIVQQPHHKQYLNRKIHLNKHTHNVVLGVHGIQARR